jgi:hypothetical protein
MREEQLRALGAKVEPEWGPERVSAARISITRRVRRRKAARVA